MFLFRIIPGLLWLDVLDKVTDQCQTFLGWRLPCGLVVLFVWLSFLGELRFQAVMAVQYVTVVHYRPNKVAIKRFYGQWQVRLGFAALLCLLSYYITFEMADDFAYLTVLRETILNENHKKKIDEIERRHFLMAHVFAQRFLQQAQSFVWIMGTLLRLKRRRFLKLATLVFFLKPVTSMLVAWCGNYALWMFIGHTLLRAFDLAPVHQPRIGSVGCYAAVLASTLHWRKYGTLEIVVTTGAAIGAEVAWRNTVKQVQTEKTKREGEGKSGIADRVWSMLADLVTADDEVETTTGRDKKKNDSDPVDDKGVKESAPAVEEATYTHPSLYSWLAIMVYWAAVGIRVDGYDLTTL